MWKIFSLVLSKTNICQRNYHNKKLSNFTKLQFCDAEIDQNTNFAKFQVPNGASVNVTIQESKVCKVSQLFIVSVSLMRGLLEGTR